MVNSWCGHTHTHTLYPITEAGQPSASLAWFHTFAPFAELAAIPFKTNTPTKKNPTELLVLISISKVHSFQIYLLRHNADHEARFRFGILWRVLSEVGSQIF